MTPSAHLQHARQVETALESLRWDCPAEKRAAAWPAFCIRSCSCGAQIGTSSTSHQRALAHWCGSCMEGAGCTGQGGNGEWLSTTDYRNEQSPEDASRCRTSSTQTNGCRSLPDSRTSPSICGRMQGGSRLVVPSVHAGRTSMCSYFRGVSSSTFVPVHSILCKTDQQSFQTRLHDIHDPQRKIKPSASGGFAG